jgi:type IV pilus assembly protein PilM
MFLDFLKKKFLTPSSFLGCDIGTTSIKIAQLSRSGQKTELVNYGLLESFGHFERANNVIQANDLKLSENETAGMLATLVKQSRFTTKHAIASIPSFSSFITTLEIPDMNSEETTKTMSYQIRQHIPLPLSEIAVDWIKVGQREDENGFLKQYVLLVAIPIEIIERYKRIFKHAGLILHALESEPLAYARSVIGSDQTPTLVVDIGARSTNITIADQGFVKFNAQIDYAGDTLTAAVARGLDISMRRAEELKKQKGLLGGGGTYELSTLELPFVDGILREVDKARADFERTQRAKIQRCLLIGGGANLLGFEAYTEKH